MPYILWRGNSGLLYGPQPYMISIGTVEVPSRITAPNLDAGLATSLIITDAVYS